MRVYDVHGSVHNIIPRKSLREAEIASIYMYIASFKGSVYLHKKIHIMHVFDVASRQCSDVCVCVCVWGGGGGGGDAY